MLKITGVRSETGNAQQDFSVVISEILKIPQKNIQQIKILKQSLDARKTNAPIYIYSFLVSVTNEKDVLTQNKLPNVEKYHDNPYRFEYQDMTSKMRPVIVGSGPSGLFCGLMLARAGLKPILLERGEDVDKRSVSVQKFWKTGTLTKHSNVQFGEGGAGTFSDGKLTTGVNDPRISFILNEFVNFGAPQDIQYSSKPHIGTNYLKPIVKNIRNEIIILGGEIRFRTVLTDLTIKDGMLKSVLTESHGKKENLETNHLILAIGHSARDTFKMLHNRGIPMIQKPFSVGVRIEHPREWINQIQYKKASENKELPAADYKMACHLENGRSAYTFCMCPGGVVVASSTEENQVVTNGMSYYKRDAINSNSALLVSVNPSDFEDDHPLTGIQFQRDMEQKAFELGGSNYNAPCQLLDDFLKGIPSKGPKTVLPSYTPNVTYTDLSLCLPNFVTETLRQAILEFDKKMHGFARKDAILTGVETRSSSPLRIVRDEAMQSSIKNIYPCGEGAGYAGGIMSCAIDGIKCAEQICKEQMLSK